jgi:cellulose synthase/poly-beta-1,6-N-acetylglucosamine synthase-like glycosyltransferase
LKTGYGFKQEDLILYGQSVGSGPTLHLASKLQNLRGVVLHSAILSGLRVLYPVKVTFWFDIFKVSFSFQFIIGRNLFALSFAVTKVFYTFQNIDKIRYVNCPVFVIHVSMSYHLCMLSVYATVFPFLVIVDQ